MRGTLFLILFLLAGCTTTGTTVDNKQMAEGYYMKGLAFFQDKKFELASVEFHRSIQTDSSHKWSYYYLGIITDTQDKLDDAIHFYSEAIHQDSDFSEAYNALGAVYSRQQKWKDALAAYHKALANKLYTTPQVPWINIGRVFMAQKKYDQAIESYREAKRYSNQDFVIVELGTALLEAGKTKEAIQEFQEGVGLVPQNAFMRYNLALAYLKNGNKKSAVSEFRKTAELAPKTDLARKANQFLKTLR
ncbi:MAG: tetratricopeptide repeat protein [Nitrospirota bacterium]